MSVLDGVCLGILGVSVVMGALDGIARPACLGAGVVLGWLVVAPLLASPLAGFLGGLPVVSGLDPGLLRGVSYLLLIIACAAIGGLVGDLLNVLAWVVPGLNLVNLAGGAAIGLVVGLLLTGGAVLALSQFNADWTQQELTHSTIAAWVGKPLAWLGTLLAPPDLRILFR
jgi:hypothetical protein